MKKKNPDYESLKDEILALKQTIFVMFARGEIYSKPTEYRYMQNLYDLKIERLKTIPEFIEE